MLSQPFAGAKYLIRGVTLLGAPGIKRFVAIPLVINIIIFTLLLWLGVEQYSRLLEQWMPRIPDWLAWLSWLFWIVFVMVAAVTVLFTFTIVANLISAPFNGLLAEAVERHLTGQAPEGEGGVMGMLRSAPTQIFDELRKLGYFLKWAVPLLILSFIPGLNLFALILWALFGAWMLAVQYADYPLGNHGLRSVEQRRVLKQKRLVAIGFGGTAMLAMMIPIANFFVMPAAVAGATAMVLQDFRAHLEAKG
jgi:CysZ protein